MWTFEQDSNGFWIARHYQADPVSGSLELVFQAEPRLTKQSAELDAEIFDLQVDIAGEEIHYQ